MADLVKVVNEVIDIQENAIPIGGLYFELTEPVSVSGLKKDSNEIELDYDKETNMLKGIRIKANLAENVSILNAYQKAYRLTNLISMRTGLYIFHKRARKIVDGTITEKVISFGTDVLLTKLYNLDMTDKALNNLLKNDSKENQQLAHFSNGLRALRDGNYGDAIKEFHQVIENENFPHLIKYNFLRHGVSHAELTGITTIQKLEDEFKIICIENPKSTSSPKGKYVDITDPKVQDILEKEAKNLRDEAIKFIDSKINVKTN